MTPEQIVIGDARHGVVRYARGLATAVRGRVADGPGGGPAHLHFTDRLWGSSPAAAAARIEALAALAPLTVTLHDLPHRSDGPQRADCYRRVVAAARGVACCTDHEEARLRVVCPDARAAVIPHAVDADRTPPARPRSDGDLAVLGFVYPGKGHAEAIAAAAEIGVAVTALGDPSPGHEADVAALREDAARRGVPFAVTGYLGDDELLARCHRAGVPLAAHRHVSASGSVATWLSAGRRPLVPDSPHSRELSPDAVTIYTDLVAAVRRALGDPGSTWLAPGAHVGPSWAEVGAAYRSWWERDVAW